MQVMKSHWLVIENFSPFHKYEYDIFSVNRGGMFYEFEVKISRSDFLKPKEKLKHLEYQHSLEVNKGEIVYVDAEKEISNWRKVPNYFSYVCPPGLIDIKEIPQFAGLFYCTESGIEPIREPTRIHGDKWDAAKIYDKVIRTYSQRSFLDGNTLMTFENREIKKKEIEAKAKRDATWQSLFKKHGIAPSPNFQ